MCVRREGEGECVCVCECVCVRQREREWGVCALWYVCIRQRKRESSNVRMKSLCELLHACSAYSIMAFCDSCTKHLTAHMHTCQRRNECIDLVLPLQLRVVKLAQSWATMRILLTIIISTLGALGYLTIILFLIIYIFAVMGLQLFREDYQTYNFQGTEAERLVPQGCWPNK